MKENNFKQTEIGLIPEDWEVVRLGDIIVYKKGKKPKILSDKWEDGFLPYLTAEFFRTGKPDKFVNVRKEAGIEIVNPDDVVLIWDGSKAGDTFTGLKGVLASTMIKIDLRNEDKVNKKLIYYFLKTKFDILNTKTTGSTIPHVSKTVFENLPVPFPPLEEQRKIARVLDKIQQAIEIQDKIIEQAKRLKKSLMQKLFTEGLYGEEQKETEIGLIPKSWEVVGLGEIGIFEYGYTETALEEDTGIKFLRITDIKDNGLILWNEVPYCKISETKLKKYQLKNGDILFARIGATTGKTCFIESPPKSVFASYLIRLKIETDVYKKFVYYYTQTPIYWSQVEANKEGKLKKGISATLLRTFKIPLPPLEEQKQIAHILSTVDKKIEVEQKRKQVLKELFKTMLHKLMSGEIRLKEVEI